MELGIRGVESGRRRNAFYGQRERLKICSSIEGVVVRLIWIHLVFVVCFAEIAKLTEFGADFTATIREVRQQQRKHPKRVLSTIAKLSASRNKVEDTPQG